MKIEKTNLDGVLILTPSTYRDNRGFFRECFQEERYKKANISQPFVQENLSQSERGVLRGLHTQFDKPQGKLVQCVKGSVYDVVADVSQSSETFGEYFCIELSGENGKQLWVPPGYVHGFLTLSNVAIFHYKCTDYYDPSSEGGVIWNDPTLSIAWPEDPLYVSEKDLALPTLDAFMRATG